MRAWGEAEVWTRLRMDPLPRQHLFQILLRKPRHQRRGFVEGGFDEAAFLGLELEDLFFHGAAGDEAEGGDDAFLA